ncbi:MAG TPA: TSUP family transporter, partial [bacterium]
MPELTLPLLAAVGGAAFLAAFAQGVTGFGSALVAMPLLSLVLGVRAAAGLVALLSLAVNVALLLPARRALPWRRIGPLLAGTLATVPAGVFFLAGADPRLARALLGAAL